MRFRDYKENGQDGYFHVFNRGNRREPIFLNDEDFNFFLLRLKQNLYPDTTTKPARMSCLPDGSFSLLCYCIMPNHFHFLIKQNKDIPIHGLISRIATSYAMYFNKKYEKVGHVFQGEFKQKPIEDDSQLKWLSAYIHQNPRLHGMIKNAIDYKWSSYGGYLLPSSVEKIGDPSFILEMFNGVLNYKEFVEDNYSILEQNKNIKKFCCD